MPEIDLTDVRLHYQITGRGEPLLLISGLGQTAQVWDAIVPPLAENFSVIQIDNRGIGQSTEKRPARCVEDYASDCLELFDALQVDRAHVAGISFGGVLAQRLAIDQSRRVDRLVLISTTDRTSPYLRHMAALLGHALRYFPLPVFFQTVELLATSPRQFDAHEVEIMRSLAGRQTHGRMRRTLAAQLHCLVNASRAMHGQRLAAPTLVLAGEYDPLIPNIYGKQLAADLPSGRFVVLRGCGHNPVSEQPQAVADLMCDFLCEDLAYDRTVEHHAEMVASRWADSARSDAPAGSRGAARAALAAGAGVGGRDADAGLSSASSRR